ncbi:DNA cytosine methyltransferase [Caenispirillum bisanense]|uniref:Cytosine-specific methyltransferase n=1 Tax=Caenispirillum bisanense TaxID=414052 RepID=A0A286H215_9PROT|nr:DNA cytosine methyltransferase [Caenispirillum bisanense]SOE01830.1 DNA (cytosine-5)-methyltransferase 1 [Caenispirillum bisanense]
MNADFLWGALPPGSARRPTFIDLFAGCGGLSLGLRNAGWSPSFAVEAHPDAFNTYRTNLVSPPHGKAEWPAWLPVTEHDVSRLIAEHEGDLIGLRGKIDAVVGGPPCQGFSTNGRRRKDDPRNEMVKSYLAIVRMVAPKLVLIENVRGFTSTEHDGEGSYADYVQQELSEIGYDTWSQLLLASDWGVPQRRPRFFLIAAKKGMLCGVDPFERLRTGRRSFLQVRGLPIRRPVSAQEALGDLETADKPLVPDPEFGESGFQCIDYRELSHLSAYARLMRVHAPEQPTDLRLPRHTGTVKDRFAKILETCPKGRSISPENRLKLGIKKRSTTPMSGAQPSPTVTTLPDDIIHYSEPRVLTVREHARLQSFPDWFRFTGPYTAGGPWRKRACPRYTQVGNAVPPLLAEALGEVLRGLLDSSSSEDLTECHNVVEMASHLPT